MISRSAFVVPLLLSASLPTSHHAWAAGAEASEWSIRAQNTIEVDPKVLARLTGQAPGAQARGEKLSIVWPDAQLESPAQPLLRVRVELVLTVGHTMAIGTHTPYPGLITKLDDARGRIVNLATGRTSMLRLSERGSWMGKFIHSDSHGSDHLAVELPFSLFSEGSRLLIAQNKLLARFDLSNRAEPFIPLLRISPTEFRDLRQQTVDIGSAIGEQSEPRTQSTALRREAYRAVARDSKLWGVAGRNQIADLFRMESLALYGCDTNELMHLEFQSSGFMQSARSKTPEFTLRLRYAPELIAPNHKVAYLYPVAGQLVFHDGDTDRVIELSPGNHGHVASRAHLSGNVLKLELGLTLRQGSEPPAVARAVISCSADGTSCSDLTLTTAVDPDGRVMSATPLSALLEGERSLAVSELQAASVEAVGPLGDPATPCPGMCPNCLTDGCTQHVGVCWDAGAPIREVAPATPTPTSAAEVDPARCVVTRDAARRSRQERFFTDFREGCADVRS